MSAEGATRPEGVGLEESADDLYDKAPCGYLSARADGTIVRVNQTLLDWVGQERTDLIGQRRFQELLTLSGQVYCETHWAPLLRMQGFVNEVAFELVRKDRSPMSVLVNAVQARDQAGEVLFTHVTVFNATERRKYERELLVERRRAERADKIKADLLAMIGHDMRSPLTTIAGAVQLLEHLSPTGQQAKYLRMLKSSSTALLALANQILDFSRIEAGQLVVADQPFDPRGLVRDTVDALLGQAEKKGLTLRAEIDPRVPVMLSGDAAKIQQVLVNLAGNAIKFTDTGSVTLSVLPCDPSDGERIEFSVADTGIGIPAGRLDAIFDEFTQATAEIGEKYGGTGLGLAIGRRLAELLGGALTVVSEVGRGSTFKLQLPLRNAAGERPENSPSKR